MDPPFTRGRWVHVFVFFFGNGGGSGVNTLMLYSLRGQNGFSHFDARRGRPPGWTRRLAKQAGGSEGPRVVWSLWEGDEFILILIYGLYTS